MDVRYRVRFHSVPNPLGTQWPWPGAELEALFRRHGRSLAEHSTAKYWLRKSFWRVYHGFCPLPG